MSNTLIDILARPEVFRFIRDHRDDDPVKMILKSANHPELPIREIAAQIQARKKAQIKLPEWQAHVEIIFPAGVSLEQCSSELTAKYKSRLVEGDTVADLTGGFGVDIYYLSQGFQEARYIERSEELSTLAAYNFEKLGSDITVHHTTTEDYLASEDKPADLYYIDPARRGASNEKVFRIEDCTPDLHQILPALIERGAKVLIKLAPLLDIQQALNALLNVKEIHVVSVKNECKELLFRIEPGFKGEPVRKAVNLWPDREEFFEFSESQEQQTSEFGQPLSYLYEPNASIMKASGFNSIAIAYGLKKLHRNSHLYTSSALVEKFPGRTFAIQEITVLNKKKLAPLLPGNKANIAVRNYPLTVSQIRKKTGIKEGGEVYLFATTLMDQSLKTIVCRKV